MTEGKNELALVNNAEINTTNYKSSLEWTADVTYGAVYFIAKLIFKDKKIEKELIKVISAKNNIERGAAANEALRINRSKQTNLNNFDQMLTAIGNGEDHYSAKNKHFTLEVGATPAAENFGINISNLCAEKENHHKMISVIQRAIKDAKEEVING